ncbi:uncharacterized protein LOC126293466 [Schistocerca gregaria]|uniref:uncharacterized protein LOC126293466 n=1 Tax=Schistocerca gregaria TaxID=7010 RepID=UPI00211F059E|nr:uncharacterized protein LOC126293466 [Schistocerca gregaria]
MASSRLLAVVVVLAAIGATTCYPQRGKIHLPRMKRTQANINEYFDEITPQIKDFFITAGLDPLQLPDLVQNFSVTDLLGIEWTGELGLKTGWLTDLSLFQRSGDAYVSYDDLELNVSISLAFPDVALSYDYVAQIMGIGPEGAVHGKVENLIVHIEAGGKLSDLKLALYDFQYLDYGKVTFHLEGNILDFIGNAILDVVTTLFRGPIMEFVETALREVITQLLERIDLTDIIGGGVRCGL